MENGTATPAANAKRSSLQEMLNRNYNHKKREKKEWKKKSKVMKWVSFPSKIMILEINTLKQQTNKNFHLDELDIKEKNPTWQHRRDENESINEDNLVPRKRHYLAATNDDASLQYTQRAYIYWGMRNILCIYI